MNFSSTYVGRLAPSPTGALHLGNVRTFMIAWLRARAEGGRVIYRTEDLDHPRDKPGAAAAAQEDLRWLGFDWDEEYVQSQRKDRYREALEKLKEQGLVYPCVCSRKDVLAAQSAPHAGEQLYYPGTCRDRFETWESAAQIHPPCWRFRVSPKTVVQLTDVFAGTMEMNVSNELGDFPLSRDEYGAGYTLAVVVDDAQMGVTEVVRADDLLSATPCQILVYKALGYQVPDFCHVPLVVGSDGRRLCKRHGDTRVAHYRAQGIRPEVIIGRLAETCGWGDGSPVALRDLVSRFALDTIPRQAVVWHEEFETA